MCGIYGFVGGELGHPERINELLDAMDGTIVHRGPDDSGRYRDGSCAMGMRRLSIIDLAGGKQPIANEDGRLVVVFNGEIYNHQPLREELLQKGHRFTTTSDTEVLVHLFEERGEALVDPLLGMFAFALWDKERQELLLVRDRLGIKPLYFAPVGDGLVFGSELKSLLCHPAIGRDVSPAALSHYLSFGHTPPDQAILAGVHKLLPGHLLRWRAGAWRVRRYWELPDREEQIAPDEAAAEVRRLLREAVRSHLVADVPVGAFLSGGVDSASVVATMAELGVRPQTFSIGFEEDEFNELGYARQIARLYDTDHHELVVRPDAWALTERLVWYLDEPFADASAIPTYLVAQLAKERVKVVLSGDGGDELFAGYDRYAWTLSEERRFGWLPAPARRQMARLAAALPPGARGKNYLRHLAQPAHPRYVDGESLFPLPHKARLLGPALRDEGAGVAPLEARCALLDQAQGDLLRRLLYLDTVTYLPLDILTKVDRMTMAHSLEARPPLLDHRLVEYAFRLPSALKLARDGTQKAVFKRAVADLLPPAILNREKRGFALPLARWLRGPLRAPMLALLRDRRLAQRGWLDPKAIDGYLTEHLTGRRDHGLPLFSLLVLELWARRFLDGAAQPTARPKESAHG